MDSNQSTFLLVGSIFLVFQFAFLIRSNVVLVTDNVTVLVCKLGIVWYCAVELASVLLQPSIPIIVDWRDIMFLSSMPVHASIKF